MGAVAGSRSGNASLGSARAAKSDEFYTRLEDIERELAHYRDHFRDKVVLLNCDDPEWSNFWRYFELNFDFLGLRKLISTHYSRDGDPTYKLEIVRGRDLDGNGVHDGRDLVKTPLAGNGDFRSDECVALLKEADIVVTNPPFSLFREYVAQLAEHDKKFLIVGNTNAITYRDVWQLVQSNRLWLGHGFQAGNAYFRVPKPQDYARGVFDAETGLVKFRNVSWFTNLDVPRRHEEIPLFRRYTPEEYPKYDDSEVIEVSRVADIPVDYDGLMGVPITFLGRHNPHQFAVLGQANSARHLGGAPLRTIIAGRNIYNRIIIRRVQS